MAEVYLAAGRVDELAQHLERWLALVSGHDKSKLEKIAQEVYAKTNDQGRLISSLTEQFFSEASSKAFQALKEILSGEQLSALITKFRSIKRGQ